MSLNAPGGGLRGCCVNRVSVSVRGASLQMTSWFRGRVRCGAALRVYFYFVQDVSF